jgi:uncharacterized protein DUF6364
MQTKLTLRMDSGLIEKAKNWARARNLSLSEAMAGFFETLVSGSVSRTDEISPWVRNLSIGKKANRRLTDRQIRQKRIGELERKHR